MKRKTKEIIKSFIIVLLLCSAVFLASKTGLFSDFIKAIPILSAIRDQSEGSGGTQTPEQSYSEACRPLTIAVTWETGLRYAVKYNDSLLSEIYDRFDNILGEVLGSASQPAPSTEEEWKQSLTSAGVYFDFGCEVPLSALARWLGTEMIYDSGAYARRICICEDGENGVLLMYLSGGSAWRCTTAAAFSSIRPRLEEHSQNDASYAFELGGEYPELEPYTLLVPGVRKIPDATAAIPQFTPELISAVLAAFGLDGYESSNYSEPDGTMVYVKEGVTVRISGGGMIVLRNRGLSDEQSPLILSFSAPDDADYIEAARSITAKLAAAAGGSSSLYFTGIKHFGESTCEVTFDYFISGSRIVQKSGAAAVVTFTDGLMTDAVIGLRTYTLSETITALLPELQAAAAVSDGRELQLLYLDSGAGLMPAFWAAG
ncbi:MAG: hypothetical protein GXY20_03330 [Clostridiales bacterium]|mgnify:CR=1 FL=1|nr:hypothetical protein [Clostridiales bacterium]